MRAWLLALVLAPLAACWSDSTGDDGECRIDRDCSDGTVCTRVHTCEPADAVYALRVEWTVRGLTTDQPGACDNISELELSVEEPSTGERFRVAPVPCPPGSFFYDKLPLSYTQVRLTAYDDYGYYLDERSVSTIGSDGLVRIALLP